MGLQRHHSALIVSSVVTVTAFVAATTYTQNRLARLDALSTAIEKNAVPSVDYLSRAAVRLTRLNQLIEDASTDSKRPQAIAAARTEVAALDAEIASYLTLEPLPGEREYWATLRADVGRAQGLVTQALDADRRAPSADRINADAVDDALDRAVRSVLATLQFDIRQSELMADDVRTVRQATLRTTVMLDTLATAIALAGVLIAYAASRRHDRLAADHAALLSSRVTELDRFAGRVAHDVLSPLGTIAAALSLVGRTADEHTRHYVERSQHALQHVKQLVDDLLLFARSGARPDPTASCPVAATLSNVVADCADAATERHVELVLEAEPSIAVRCSPGVMASIVQNLVRNAVNYMGTQPVRRVVVRAKPSASAVRLEVEDTGPGIPAALMTTIFDPFVRGPQTDVSGTGLGLATAKRLVEGHGGRIGVRSTPGAGSLFWIELPAAAPVHGDAIAGAEPHHV